MTDRPDNFADYPVLLGDVRSDKKGSAAFWSPRDVLIDLLREIDQGKIAPDAIVICTRTPGDDGNWRTIFRSSARDVHTSLWLLAAVTAKITA